MSAVALVYTLFGSRDAAMRVARRLIEERLIACANLLGEATSIYEWNGVLEETAEVPVLFKTAPSRREALMARIAELHDYEVPAILALPVEAADSGFARWVGEQLAK
ncbi:divalent-cation tolerance protein CutA [Sphingobium sp. LB126]|uniref:divalent-cation tolerance protein CutA n=1 Tax=Sphingobium sp. LB126 TaxID=1983755 RepID=UPI000C20A9BB|nr:divalent-cation tolerance protein CutA [Sphingobium sp. LB126]PJG47583.1 divalent-cation tolerance protein CutA [Sphingobium sp. LB126]